MNEGQLARNWYYIGAIIYMLQFLAINQLPLRGSVEAFNSQGDASIDKSKFLIVFCLFIFPKIFLLCCELPQNDFSLL